MESALPALDLKALALRLSLCVERLGGKRALATACNFSEAQLYRYLDGDVVIPSDRLLAIAHAARVDPAWLLTGDGVANGPPVPDIRPPFAPRTLANCVAAFEEMLAESGRKFTPQQRGLALVLMYEALRLEEKYGRGHGDIDRRLLPYYPDFLAALRTDTRMETYLEGMAMLEYGAEPSLQALQQFDNLVRTAIVSAYDGAAGEMYFNKMGQTLLPDAAKRLLLQVEEAIQLTGKTELDWLDAGCGNGRHLSFLYQHCPNLRLHGFDASDQALHHCQQLVRAGKLPIGIVEKADFRNLPYPDASMDALYCRYGLDFTLYAEHFEFGAHHFMKEAARILRPGGTMTLMTISGHGRDYLYFLQYYTPEILDQLASSSGFKIARIYENAPANETGGVTGKDFSSRFEHNLEVVFIKHA